MLNDLCYAVRSLSKTPVFTAVAVLTLALGIGLNTAAFSLLNTAVLRSLPVRDPQDLRVVNWVGDMAKLDLIHFLIAGASTPTGQTGEKKWGAFTYPTYELLRDQAQGVSAVFGFQPFNGNLSTPAGASTANGLFVSGNFFQGYGAQPLLGRPLTAQDDQNGAAAATVISYRLWEREFRLDPKALGQTIVVNGTPCTIVGILPHGFADPLAGNPSDLYVPFVQRAAIWSEFSPAMMSPRMWAIQVMARLAPGADDRHVTASMNTLFHRALLDSEQKSAAGHLKIVLDDGRRGPLSANLIFQQIAKPTWVLMAAVLLLLLIACANLAGLLLARVVARTREFAVRAAIGASRWKLMRLLLLENVLLAIAGGALGLLFAAWVCSSLSQSFFSKWLTGNARLEAVLDAPVLIFTFAVSLLTVGFFGILPVWRATRADSFKGLKSEKSSGVSRLQLGGVLVAVQVGLSVILLAGAGLLAQTFANLNRFDPGFDSSNLLLFDLKANQSGYSGSKEAQFYEAVKSALVTLPGVDSVTVSSGRRLIGHQNIILIDVPGRILALEDRKDAQLRLINPEQHPMTSFMSIDDDYFSTMDIPRLLGRNFNAGDVPGGSPVAVVNKVFVDRYLKDKNPIGSTFSAMGGNAIYRIVGVAGNAKSADLKHETSPMAYFSHRQSPVPNATFNVRSSLPPASLAPAVRKIVAALDPKVPIVDITTQKLMIDKLNSQERILAVFGGFVGMLAALLAGIGLFGLLAYAVSLRTSEIGVRMALGARQGDVARLIVGQGLGFVAVGLILGLIGALGATRFLRSFLWGVEATDFLTMVTASLLLCLVAAMACFIPTRRATQVDPLVALRSE